MLDFQAHSVRHSIKIIKNQPSEQKREKEATNRTEKRSAPDVSLEEKLARAVFDEESDGRLHLLNNFPFLLARRLLR